MVKEINLGWQYVVGLFVTAIEVKFPAKMWLFFRTVKRRICTSIGYTPKWNALQSLAKRNKSPRIRTVVHGLDGNLRRSISMSLDLTPLHQLKPTKWGNGCVFKGRKGTLLFWSESIAMFPLVDPTANNSELSQSSSETPPNLKPNTMNCWGRTTSPER